MTKSPQPTRDNPEQTLYLVDISSFIFRAFYGIRPLHTKNRVPVNAVYGVATMLARVNDEAKPEHMAVVYDSKEPSFRKEVYAEYKANRAEPPEDLIPQFALVEELIKNFEIRSYRQSGIEADDLIATLTKRWIKSSKSAKVVIVSSDKDLMQLVTERVQIWDTMNDKRYGPEEVEAKFGVKPSQIRDYLALVGDSSDNIPGVPSIGPKTAADLLREHGDLESILKAAGAGKISGKRGEVIHQNVADARLSAQLATVREDLEVEIRAEDLNYHFHVTEKCADFLRSLDFHSLVARWGAAAAKPSSSEAAPQQPEGKTEAKTEAGIRIDKDTFRTVLTMGELAKVIAEIEKTGEFGFDVETTSLNPREAELVGISICTTPEYGYYIPVGHRGTSIEQLPLQEVLEKLRPFLENPKYKKIGQNLKYDFSVMAEQGIAIRGVHADTMVAGYILNAERRHNLETLAAEYLGYAVTTYEQVCGKGKDQIGFDLVPIDQATRYSAEDAWIALRLWHRLKALLEKEGLMEVFEKIDLPLVEILSEMERTGVCIDVAWLTKLSTEFGAELRKIEERISAFTNGPINLNSPKQLGHLLFDELKLPPQGKTKTGYSTDASVLEALAPLHEVPKLLLEYREISKLKGTYVDPLPQLRDAKTGKIHAGFHQTVAATGRLSSSDPNLQNIPIRTERGMKIRRAFVPEKGNLLLAADYSQIELRLLAHMSGDPELLRAFQNDEDVHRRTASEIYGLAPEKVTDRERGMAKAINFGLMYGKTAFGLAQELDISQREAKETIEKYFTRYSAVKRFLDQLVLDAKEKGYAVTLLGRKRSLQDINSRNPAVRGNAERMAMNTPIQGTAADLMKLAMIEIDGMLKRKKLRSKLIIQVHDEVLLDCPKDEIETVQKLVVETMENAGQGGDKPLMKLSVPLRVNSGTGESWMDL